MCFNQKSKKIIGRHNCIPNINYSIFKFHINKLLFNFYFIIYLIKLLIISNYNYNYFVTFGFHL